jgi:hypothetical protein
LAGNSSEDTLDGESLILQYEVKKKPKVTEWVEVKQPVTGIVIDLKIVGRAIGLARLK